VDLSRFPYATDTMLSRVRLPFALLSVSLARSLATAVGMRDLKPRLMDNAEVIDPRPSKSSHRATIIWLHGLGDSSEGFLDLFQRVAPANTRVVLPNAPVRSITVNAGARMQAWYDIGNLDRNRADATTAEDRQGISESAGLLTELIESEAALVGGSDKIFLGGFSQGGAMSIHVGLRYANQLGGIISASGYVLQLSDYTAGSSDQSKASAVDFSTLANRRTPILAYHGTADQMVPIAWATSAYERLKSLGANISIEKESGMQHSMSDSEIRRMRTFWASVMPSSATKEL